MSSAGSPTDWIPAPPRRPRLRALVDGHSLALFAGGLLVLFMSLVATWAILDPSATIFDDWTLARRGVPMTAVATTFTKAGAEGNAPWIRIGFRFQDGSGAWRESSSGTIDAALVDRARSGASLPGRYDPRRPERARLDGTTRAFAGWTVFFPLAIDAGGAVLALAGFARLVSRRRVLVAGSVTNGRVTAVSRSPDMKGFHEVYYAFAAAGDEVIGRITTRDPPPVGGVLAVVYDVDRPRRNVLVSADDFRV